MSQKRRGRQKENVLKKLEAKVEEGNFYEALQMYKTLYSRFAMLFAFSRSLTLHNRYLSKEEFDKAKNIVTSGANTLLKFKQVRPHGCECSLRSL